MNKIKVLSISVVVLMLMNIGILLFFTLNKPPHPPHGGLQMGPHPKDIIIKELNLDESQIEAFDDLILEHRTAIQEAEEMIHLTRNKLFETLTKEDQSIKDSLVLQIGNQQMEIEKIHYNHFESIKKILKPNQLKKFELFIGDLGRLFKPRPPKP